MAKELLAAQEQALFQAITQRRLQEVAQWLAAGGNPNIGEEDPNYGIAGKPTYTPLQHAVMYQYLDIVEVLLQAGADPNTGRATDDWSQNPLALATKRRNRKLVRMLLAAGAETHDQYLTGADRTALAQLTAEVPGVYTDLERALEEPESVIHLDLAGQGQKVIPAAIGSLSNLRELYLGANRIKQLPEECGALTNLEILSLHSGLMKQLPLPITVMMRWKLLKLLDLRGNKIAKQKINLLRGSLSWAQVLQFDSDLDS